jgi:hypothetical protein
MLHTTYRCGAASGFAVVWIALTIIGVGLLAAGCTTSGQPALGIASGSGVRTVAFESIDGPPEVLFRKLVMQLGEEASAHQIAIVSREAPAQFRIRGYIAAHVQGQKTTITWVWDVYGTDQERAVRLVGEVPGAPSERAWSAADDAVVSRLARDGMTRLATFLAVPASGQSAESARPREQTLAATTPGTAGLPAAAAATAPAPRT